MAVALHLPSTEEETAVSGTSDERSRNLAIILVNYRLVYEDGRMSKS